MPCAPERLPESDRARGGVEFVPSATLEAVGEHLRAQRFLVARAFAAGFGRGNLKQGVDHAVEGALALRGALPPGVEVDAGVEASIADQVFRACALDLAGLAVFLPSLAAMSDDRRTMGLKDSAVLRAWMAAAERAPVRLVLEDEDRQVAILAPTRLEDLAATGQGAPRSAGRDARLPGSSAPAPASPPVVEPARGLREARGEGDDERPSEPPSSGERVTFPALHDGGPRGAATWAAEAPLPVPATPTPTPTPTSFLALATETDAARGAEPGLTPDPPEAQPRKRFARLANGGRGARGPLVEAPAAVEPPVEGPVGRPQEPPAAGEQRTADLPAELPGSPQAERLVNAAEWRNHALDLDKARGPKPTAVLEKLFATRYVPLLGAVARGEVDATVKAVVDAFRSNFEHSYREAYSALRVTGKRPPMVFDAPEVAARIGRLNGARTVKLLLVDAMRFDLGERVTLRLATQLAGRAVCIERSLLWAALPTTTPTQLALLARGADGLRDAPTPGEKEPEIVRGRAVSTLRRERLGSREVMKLDVVEARLRMAGPAPDERLDALADEVVSVLARFVETLPPRTLLFVFGDHGFRLPTGADGRSTGAATHGGTTPEEVLVPGYAWLVGEVH